MWCDYRLDNAKMTSPIFYITTTFHFGISEPSVLNLLNVPHYVNPLWPYLVGTPAGYLKTRPSSGENQHDRQSNDWQHKTGKSRSLEGQPEKAERRLEPTEDQGCTAATRVQADAVRAGAVSRVDREGLQADERDRSCGGEELLRSGGNWGRTRRCFKGTKTVWIVNGVVESARLPLMWPGLQPGAIWGLSLLLGLAFVRGFFSGFCGFSLTTKTNISKFQFDQDRGTAWKTAKANVASFINILIYYLFYNVTEWRKSRGFGGNLLFSEILLGKLWKN